MNDVRRTLESLVEYFRGQGFHSEFRAWAMGETALVASQPDRTSTITAYKRMAFVGVRENGSWYTYVHGVDAGEDLTLEEARGEVDALMKSSDAQWQAEFDRRVDLVFPDRLQPERR